jgi:flagellar secretion chaperone FliS
MNTRALDRYRSDGLASQSPQRLLVLLYQRLGADLRRAEELLAAGDRTSAHGHLVHAQEIVGELRLALDVGAWPGAAGLAELYAYLDRTLVEANVAKSPALVAECRVLVAPLIDAWEQAYHAVRTDRSDAHGRILA